MMFELFSLYYNKFCIRDGSISRANHTHGFPINSDWEWALKKF